MVDGRKFSSYGKVKGRRSLAKSGSMTENFQDYLLNSTLHGLRYIGTSRLSILERSVQNGIETKASTVFPQISQDFLFDRFSNCHHSERLLHFERLAKVHRNTSHYWFEPDRNGLECDPVSGGHDLQHEPGTQKYCSANGGVSLRPIIDLGNVPISFSISEMNWTSRFWKVSV
jgi:hypothetical protein